MHEKIFLSLYLFIRLSSSFEFLNLFLKSFFVAEEILFRDAAVGERMRMKNICVKIEF
jgi:hypothetical protein